MEGTAKGLSKEERAKILGLEKLVGNKDYDVLDTVTDGGDARTRAGLSLAQSFSELLAAIGTESKGKISVLDACQMMLGALGMSHARAMGIVASVHHLTSEQQEELCAELAHVYRVNLIANVRARVFDE